MKPDSWLKVQQSVSLGNYAPAFPASERMRRTSIPLQGPTWPASERIRRSGIPRFQDLKSILARCVGYWIYPQFWLDDSCAYTRPETLRSVVVQEVLCRCSKFVEEKVV